MYHLNRCKKKHLTNFLKMHDQTLKQTRIVGNFFNMIKPTANIA